MSIRVTTQMTTNMMKTSINKSYADIYKVYQQITSGKKLSEMSENPSDGTKIVKYNTQLDKLGDWANNIETAKDELSMSWDTLGLINDNLSRINDLAIQAANSYNSDESVEAIRKEIAARTETITSLANTKYQDKYIFAGSNTGTVPYKTDENLKTQYFGTPSSGSWQRNVEISEGTTIPVNVNGEDIFGNGNTGIFAALEKLNTAMSADDIDFRAISESLNPIQDGIKSVTSAQGVISSRVQRLEATSSINSDLTLGTTERKSAIEDTDLTQAATDLVRFQTALQASMKAGSSIMYNSSLLDFI